MKRRNIVIGISVIIGLLLIAKIFREIPLREIWSTFKHTTPWVILGYVVVSIIMLLIHTLRWKIIADTEKKVPFMNLFAYKIVGYGVSFITPAAKMGGEPLRAAMLQKHGFKMNRALSTVVIDKVIDIVTLGCLFILAAILTLTTLAAPQDMMVLLVIAALLFTGVMVYFYSQVLRGKNLFVRIFKRLRLNKLKKFKNTEKKIMEFEQVIVQFHRTRKDAFYKVLMLSVFAWIVMFAEYALALRFFGITGMSFLDLFLIITVLGAAYMIPIPLALGVLEAGEASLFLGLGLQAAAGVGLSMLVRFRDLMWTVVAAIILFVHGFDFKKAYQKSLESKLEVPKTKKKRKNKKKVKKSSKKNSK